jgi:hypothetical protein
MKLTDPTVFDVCPRALCLLGLPVGEDVEGRILVEAISPELLAERPVKWTPTHDTGTRGVLGRAQDPGVRVARGTRLAGHSGRTG